MQLIHKESRTLLAEKVLTARRLIARMQGLLGKKHFPPKHTLWITPCTSGIHTFFMQFPIDIIFVTRNLQITKVAKNIPASRLVYPPWFSATYSVFEFQSPGFKYPLKPGEALMLEETSPPTQSVIPQNQEIA